LLLSVITACKGTTQKASGPQDKSAKERDDKTPLLRVGARVVTVGDFARMLDDMSPYIRARFRAPERRRELLDSVLEFELLAAEARHRGYDKHADVVRVRKQLMVEEMLKDKVDRQLSEKQFSDEEVKRFYEAHRDEFNKPEEVRVSHILVQSDRQAKQLLEQVKTHPNDLEFFETLARTHSLDEKTKSKGGDLNFFARPEDKKASTQAIPKALAEAAFTLTEPGTVYPKPVKTEQGYHIVFLVRRRAALSRSLTDASRLIRNRLYREERDRRLAALVSTLRKRYTVTENLEALKTVDIQSIEKKPTAAKVAFQ